MLIPIFVNGQRRYQDNRGNQYKYDLSQPMDQISYSTDIDAQMRDQKLANPTRNPNGGGIYE